MKTRQGPGVIEIVNRGDLPPGRVFQCLHCGTRLKEGQPHSAVQPVPHQSLTTLVVREELTDGLRGYYAGSYEGETGYKPQLRPVGIHADRSMGRELMRPLVQNENGYWEEARA